MMETRDAKSMLRGLAATLRLAADNKIALSTEILRETADVIEWFANTADPPG
jgi:hypothetical protein